MLSWFRNLSWVKQVTALAVMVSTVLAALTAVANVLEAGEPNWIATRRFTRETVNNAVAQVTSNQQILEQKITSQQERLAHRLTRSELTQVQGQIQDVRSKIKDRDLLLKRPDGPEEYKAAIRQQTEEFKDNLELLNRRAEQLRKELNADRP